MSTRIQSADGTLRVELGPAGAIVTIDGHEWHWIVSGVDSSLHLAGNYVRQPGHDGRAPRPEDCSRCAKFLLDSEGAGVNQREAAPRNNNVSGAADCGESRAEGARAASSSAPISSRR